jgi:uncharacterized protein (TIGR02680 family)
VTEQRYRPTRAGIINLWDYRDEEFLFVDGWLVLRGPNGSGKTKALEVLFPFVLDGRIEPRRLNPFASEDRTMKSNLLYRGQEVAHGYVWMEFSDGDHYVTIGIGLRAHRHVDKVTRWHFVAEGRVGVDISLLDADDRPLLRKDMIAQLGADAVRDTPEDYRHLVDTRLYGLGPARYEQMLDLVLTLRRPQLAKDLNPAALSSTLQRGLRPLEEHLLVEAAGSFDDMEAVARTLEGLVAADTATAAFLSVFTTYLRTHARAAADAVTGRLDTVARREADVVAARQAYTDAEAAEQAAATVLGQAAERPVRLRARLDSLKESTAYRSHEQLAHVRGRVADLRRVADREREAVTGARNSAQARHDEDQQARTAHLDAEAHARRVADQLAAQAEAAGIAWAAADATADGLTPRVAGRATARQADIDAVRAAAGRLATAERDHARAATDFADAETAVQAAQRDHYRAGDVEQAARTQAAQALRRWADQHSDLLTGLHLPDLDEQLTQALRRTGEPEAVSLGETFRAATQPAITRLQQDIATARATQEEQRARRTATRAERDRVAAEHDDAPPADATRPAAREGRPGAPLWRLVRFADTVSDAEAGAIEAALHAAGLLDAWLYPDDEHSTSALGRAEQDAQLAALPPERRPTGPTLANLLVPEDQPAVPADRITAMLASIALVDTVTAHSPAVDTAGRYGHGLLLGAHSKPAAEYIGATARAARRAARLREYDRQLADLDAAIAALNATIEQAHSRLDGIEAAARELPPVHPILRTVAEVVATAATLRARREAATEAGTRLDRAIAEQAAATTALARLAAERALPADQVDRVASAVRHFEQLGQQLVAAHFSTATAARAVEAAHARYREARDALHSAQARHEEAAQQYAEMEEAYRTLDEAVGADVQQVLADVATTQDALGAAERDLREATEAAASAREARATANSRVEAGAQALADARTEAGTEAHRLRPFAKPDLLALLRIDTAIRWPALPADEPATDLDPAVHALHRAILAATRDLTPTETSLKQSATRLTTAFNDLLAQLPAAGLDHRPELDSDEGLFTVLVADEQGLSPVAHFAERIARERHDQEQLLTDSEQRILEDALLGQLARQIHTRTIEARDLVDAMDTQLRARRMSSGLTVGVGWRLADELDGEQREVCKLLERNPASLGPSQLATLRRHFATRIKAARAASPERPYRDLLADVLDYRRWRVFAFTLHRPGSAPEPLTRARHSQLSGGEQSVSLHLPLFAAANALFTSARPDAPRMLGLDEAFAGVDDNGRAELMGLAGQFDLDLMMTGYDLWATHPQVRGAAHYDLSHSTLEHTVAAVLLVWDGADNVVDVDGSLARALGSPETRRAPASIDTTTATFAESDLGWATE